MKRWIGLGAAIAISVSIAACGSPAPSPTVEDLASDLADLPGVSVATGEVLTGSPDRPTEASVSIVLSDQVTPAQLRTITLTWRDGSRALHKKFSTLALDRAIDTAAWSSMRVQSDAYPRLLPVVQEWLAVSGAAPVVSTVSSLDAQHVVSADVPIADLLRRLDAVVAPSPVAERWRLQASDASLYSEQGYPTEATCAEACAR